MLNDNCSQDQNLIGIFKDARNIAGPHKDIHIQSFGHLRENDKRRSPWPGDRVWIVLSTQLKHVTSNLITCLLQSRDEQQGRAVLLMCKKGLIAGGEI